MSSFIICPVCQKKLSKEERCFSCINGHSFDVAKEGYVNLLPVNKKHSADPGDTKEMVLSRRAFLDTGYYDIFSDKLRDIVNELIEEGQSINVLDIGAGEGYYTGKIGQFLKEKHPKSNLFAFDISKWAVKYASKRYKNITFAVASAFNMPVESDSIALAINIFAPLVPEEISRVLKKGGYLIYAVPGERHLFSMKEVLYDSPYENAYREEEYHGFEFVKRVTVNGEIELKSSHQVQSLFAMTPYFWKTPRDGVRRLEEMTSLITTIHFDFLVFVKK